MAEALAAGAVIAVPGVGGYCLAVRAGSPEVEERLVELAADPEGPHYAVGHTDDVRALTSGWTDELGRLLERCWPGPVEVFLPRADAAGTDGEDRAERRPPTRRDAPSRAWAVVVGMPDGRALRRLCREHGPVAHGAAQLHRGAPRWPRPSMPRDVALVVDGGRREGSRRRWWTRPCRRCGSCARVRCRRPSSRGRCSWAHAGACLRRPAANAGRPEHLGPGPSRPHGRGARLPLHRPQGADRASCLPVAAAPRGRRSMRGRSESA